MHQKLQNLEIETWKKRIRNLSILNHSNRGKREAALTVVSPKRDRPFHWKKRRQKIPIFTVDLEKILQYNETVKLYLQSYRNFF